jgi:hypothetical protein
LVLGVEVRPSFSVSQVRDKEGLNLACLTGIKDYFGCGFIRFSKKDNTWKYECRDLSDIRLKIIPHFEKFALRTKKLIDFNLFCFVVSLVSSKQHLNYTGLRLVIDKSYQINGGKRKFQKEVLISKIKKIL